MLAAMTMGGRIASLMVVVDGGVGQRGIIHNPVGVHLLLQRMILPWCVIVHPILVKATLQPPLHRVTTEMREQELRPGIMWAWCAMAGRAGMLNVHVCMECTHSPFGRRVRMVGHGGSSHEKVTSCARLKDGPWSYGGHVDIDSFEECSCSKCVFWGEGWGMLR